ncbi:DUF4352 domain-containing protein [Apilactobacillus timberlakei]|uniref:DUF4352 domain-containing protein n=1 Tax=Apilactobacillus timberlakei TaxID=2008380 RepID=UPI0011297AF3|nr:DUF4352 domain-containing protein [Apilactobacillus timberlakei]TPR19954.1 DUF4352 domain-containing protein [Apilactobacillus timberlakei]TPR21672.1 DUF4352 domain-containing protein [Apilactobacillus timberlakei]TPR22918.1 DUF4352 domain-containing protein [Apilactobacillus timberlakei]
MPEKQVKPWYKVWWIWVIIVVVLFVLFSMIGGNSSDHSDDSSSSKDVKTTKGTTKKTSDSTSALDKQYKVGQTIDYKGYKIKVDDVTYDNGSEYENPKSGNKYVVSKVTIKNDTDDKQDYNPFDFKLSANGNATDLDESTGNDNYDNNDLSSGTLEKGASVTGYLIGQANPNAKLKLQYQPNYFDNKTVDVDLN